MLRILDELMADNRIQERQEVKGQYSIPDNETRSVVVRPTAENLAVMEVKLSKGDGIEVFAPA